MKKQFCKKCKSLVIGDVCPNCGSKSFTTTYYGRVNIINVEKSIIAKKLNITKSGEYALKVR